MNPRYFTIEEANELLPVLEPLVDELLRRRSRATAAAKSLAPALSSLRLDVGGPEATALAAELASIEDLVDRIQSYGCVVKSLEAGLLDFLYELDGRDVFLCWRYGEPQVGYYHDLHAGFSGRRPL